MLQLDDLPSNVVDRAAFSACTNDVSRIACLLSSPDFIAILKPQLLDEQKTYLKCSKTSSEHREQGNAAYASGNNRLALSLYNQAIRYAPSYSRELSLAFGNRSAVLFNLKHYNLSRKDIHRSLDLLSLKDEDEIRRQRLEQRQQQCLKHLTEEQDENINDENNRLQHELDRLRTENSFNNHYPSLTSHADIHTSTDRGRHVVSADSPLKPGTIILVEQAYASVLLPSSWSTHCHMCLRRIDLVLFPCSQCTRALYCSNECLQNALVWHAFECRLPIDRLDKMSMLTLRLITKTGWQHLFRNRIRFETILQNQFNQSDELNQKYEWNNYENILRLETNSNKRTMKDLFERCQQACLIGSSLINNTSFCPQALDNLDLRIYLCSLICSHLQSLPCNAHEISEFVHHRLAPLSSSCIEIGAGIFATLSLFNHSCNPLVTRNFIRDTVVVRLLGSVNSSAVELTDNYGCLSATMDKTGRHDKLNEQYHFQCQCEACEYQWPNYDQLPEGTGKTNVESQQFNEAFTRLIEGQIPVREDLDTFEIFIAQCDKEIPTEQQLKGKMYNNVQEAYKQCLNFFYHSMYTED